MMILLMNQRLALLATTKQKYRYFFYFSGKQGVQLMSKIKKQLQKSVSSIMKTCIINECAKLSTQFLAKDRTRFEHGNNMVYFNHCSNVACNETYGGESDRRINEHIIDLNKWDKNSHLLKHPHESQYTHVWIDNSKIFNGNYKSNTKAKVSEVLYIKAIGLEFSNDLVAVILQLNGCVNLILVDSFCHLISPFYLYFWQ